MARHRDNQEEEKKDTCSWMMTFSDLSTLLLTFFVLLLSMSSLNDRAFRDAFVNFNKASGILYFKDADKVNLKRESMVDDLVKTLKSLYLLEIQEKKEKKGGTFTDEEMDLVFGGNSVLFKKRPKDSGFSFVFGEKMLFAKGSADLNPDVYPLLRKLGEFLVKTDYRVYIDGHTDSIPIHSAAFDSNDQLSISRAIRVLIFLMDECLVPPKKLALAGYGSTRPISDNKTQQGRAENRRVEMIFKKLKG